MIVVDAFTLDILSSNECYVDRFDSKSWKPASFIPSRTLVSITPILVLACIIIIAITGVYTTQGRRRLSFSPLIACVSVVLSYLTTYNICLILKDIIGDNRCHKSSNSVSGHYTMFFYAGIMMNNLMKMCDTQWNLSTLGSALLSRDNIDTVDVKDNVRNDAYRKVIRTCFAWVYLVYLLNSATVLFTTFFHGYHTARQVYLGVALAILTADITTWILRRLTKGVNLIDARLPLTVPMFAVCGVLVSNLMMMMTTGRNFYGYHKRD